MKRAHMFDASVTILKWSAIILMVLASGGLALGVFALVQILSN